MPKKVYIISLVCCVLTAPFFVSSQRIIMGFPAWAFYSLVMTIVYSFIIAILLQIYWPTQKKRHDS